jgi:hypothetical protein
LSIGGFVDAKHRPSSAEVESALAGKAVLWNDLLDHLSKTYDQKGALNFGGPKYGWELSFRKGGRPLADLYPSNGFFVAQVVLGRAATEAAKKLPLGEHVRSVFDGARQLYDGRWLFVPVRTKRDLEDVKLLIDAKVRSK